MWWIGRYWFLAENAEHNCLRGEGGDRHTTVRLVVTFALSVIHAHSLTVVRLSFSVIPSHSCRSQLPLVYGLSTVLESAKNCAYYHVDGLPDRVSLNLSSLQPC